MLPDLRFAVRTLAKTPGFTLLAVAMVALGVGASTACFSFLHAFFLKPPPFTEPDRLVSLHIVEERSPGLMAMSYPNFLDYRRQGTVFTDLALHLGFGVRYHDGTRQVYSFGQLVSGSYFDLLGVKPALGRALTPADDSENGASVVVISHNFWLNRLGGAADVLGRSLQLEDQPFTVVGVAPAGFKGINLFGDPDFWLPVARHPQLLRGPAREFFLSRRSVTAPVLGRLKPGVSLRQAEDAMKPISADLAAAYPADNAGRSLRLVPITQAMVNPNLRTSMVKAGNLLLALAGLVLLIACANLANLLLARAGGRQREVAVRVALGASRRQVVRQLLVEHLLLALLGGAAGVAAAGWIRDLLWLLRPQWFPGALSDVSIDGGVMLFAVGVTVLTGLLFGVFPAITATRINLVSVLKRDVSGGGASLWSFRHLLVIAQIALSVLALAVAGLFVRSLQRANAADLGWNHRNLAVLSLNLQGAGYDPHRSFEFYERALARLRSSPGVVDAGLSSRPFLTGVNPQRTVRAPDSPDEKLRTRGQLVSYACIWPGFLEMMEVPLLAGRHFAAEENTNQRPTVIIVNEAFARLAWPGEDPVGKTVKLYGSEAPVEVVGVVRNLKDTELHAEPAPFAYFLLRQIFHQTNVFHVRTAGDPADLLATLRKELQALDPAVEAFNARTMDDLLRNALWGQRTGATLMSAFALTALLLASLGLYAVMAQAVQQRTREIGIRLAIGAQARSVLGLIVKRGALVAGAGLLAGLGASLALTRYLRSFLFEIEPTDPVTFAAIAVVLSAVALFACWLPARRATQVDPLIALRSE